jgi:hypothetical protein
MPCHPLSICVAISGCMPDPLFIMHPSLQSVWQHSWAPCSNMHPACLSTGASGQLQMATEKEQLDVLAQVRRGTRRDLADCCRAFLVSASDLGGSLVVLPIAWELSGCIWRGLCFWASAPSVTRAHGVFGAL